MFLSFCIQKKFKMRAVECREANILLIGQSGGSPSTLTLSVVDAGFDDKLRGIKEKRYTIERIEYGIM